MTNDEFKTQSERIEQEFQRMLSNMAQLTNDKGQYPKIEFSDIILAYQVIMTGLKESRAPKKLILTSVK